MMWLAYRGDTELAEHWVLDLIKNPNPMQSGRELMEARMSYFLLAGNIYDERVTATGNEPKEIYTLRPDRMKIIPSVTGMVAKFEYDANGKKMTWEVDPTTGESDILHTKTFNPTDDWYGLSFVESGAYSIDVHNESMAWMMGLLQNSARPSGAMVHTPKDGQGSLTDDQFARLKAEMEASYQGAKNAGRPMLLEGGLDWKSMGLGPKDMVLDETKNSAARDICLAFGVPPMLIGIPGDNTYSNYSEARLAFWEDTVLPLTAKVMDPLAEWLTDGEIEIRPDLDKIPAIVDKRQTLWTMLDQTTSLTTNEKREAMGYGPIEGGDTLPTQQQATELDLTDQKALNFINEYNVPQLRAVK
jgi:HK97 family phage portal protein